MEEQDVVEQNSTTADVPEQTENPTPEGETAQPTPEGQTETDVKPETSKPEDDSYWKNRAMEYQRKLDETVHSIPKVIEETLAKTKQPEKQEYSIEQLEAFLETTDDVQSKVWAKSKIRELERVEREAEYQRLIEADRSKLMAEQRRVQVENEIVRDPRFSDAFVEQGGTKVWNPQSKLTQLASGYMKDPALANRPDALAIAMKLAYADVVAEKTGSTAKVVASVKRENAKLKQQTLVEGGGVSGNVPKMTEVEKSMSELAKTGSKNALRSLTQAVLRQQGIIK